MINSDSMNAVEVCLLTYFGGMGLIPRLFQSFLILRQSLGKLSYPGLGWTYDPPASISQHAGITGIYHYTCRSRRYFKVFGKGYSRGQTKSRYKQGHDADSVRVCSFLLFWGLLAVLVLYDWCMCRASLQSSCSPDTLLVFVSMSKFPPSLKDASVQLGVPHPIPACPHPTNYNYHDLFQIRPHSEVYLLLRLNIWTWGAQLTPNTSNPLK